MRLRSGASISTPRRSVSRPAAIGQREKAKREKAECKQKLADQALEVANLKFTNNELARKHSQNEFLVGYILAYIQYYDPEMKGLVGPEGFEMLRSVLKMVNQRNPEQAIMVLFGK